MVVIGDAILMWTLCYISATIPHLVTCKNLWLRIVIVRTVSEFVLQLEITYTCNTFNIIFILTSSHWLSPKHLQYIYYKFMMTSVHVVEIVYSYTLSTTIHVFSIIVGIQSSPKLLAMATYIFMNSHWVWDFIKTLKIHWTR